MADNDNTSGTLLEDPCINCPRTTCTGCPSEPVLLTTPFYIDTIDLPKREKKPKKKSWIEKQQARRGWQ